MLRISPSRMALWAPVLIICCCMVGSILSSNSVPNVIQLQIEGLDLRLNQVLSNIRHTHDDDLVDLNLSRYAWAKMENVYQEHIKSEVKTRRPYILGLLKRANVSDNCSMAIDKLLDDLADMKIWASRMWNAWGKFPAPGLFEGSYTDLGSFKSCLRIKNNKYIGETQYCTLDFQPILPTRPRYHSITKRVLNINEGTGHLEGGDTNFANKKAKSMSSHTFSSKLFKKEDASVQAEESSILTSEFNLKKNSILAELAEKAHFFYYVKLRIGSCWPEKCARSEIQKIVQQVGAQAVLQVSDVKCVTKTESRSSKLNFYQWIAILSLSSIAMLSIVACFIDIVIYLLAFFEHEDLAEKLLYFNDYLEIFSLMRNFKRLFSIEVSQSMTAITTTLTDGRQQQPVGRQLTCLRGLKVLSMIWVIYGHSLLNTDYQSFTHAYRILNNQLTNFFVLPSLNPNFSVDTFFLISGLLSAYVVLYLDVKFNAFLYTVARYIRLTPQLVVVTMMFFLLPLTGEGPLHKQSTEVHAERCYKNFWVNLIYLQSYVNRRELCIIPSWWLSIEMTFHLISVVVLYLLIKKPKIGVAMNVLVIGFMTAIGTYIHYSNGMAIGYLPSIPQKYEVEYEQTQWFFHRPYPHAASYFIGIGMGFILVKKTIDKLSDVQLFLGWFASALGIMVPLWGIYYWNLGYPYSQLEATIYYNSCQILWPLSIAWIILACSLGYGGPVDLVLSSKFFVPLARITYMTYLSHILIVYYFTASLQHTLEPSAMNLLYICVSNIVLSLVFGAILSLIYEAPILNIQRMALRRKYSYVDTKSSKSNNINVNDNKLMIET